MLEVSQTKVYVAIKLITSSKVLDESRETKNKLVNLKVEELYLSYRPNRNIFHKLFFISQDTAKSLHDEVLPLKCM